MHPRLSKKVFLLCLFSQWLLGQVSFFGDIYIAAGNEMHIAYPTTYLSGATLTTARGIEPGVVSFKATSLWEQTKKNSFVSGVVRVYDTGEFIFPLGEDELFSPIGFTITANPQHIDVRYYQQHPFGYPIVTEGYLSPQYHFWEWESTGNATARAQVYWNEAHRLASLAPFGNIDTLEIGVLEGNQWKLIPTTLEINSFENDNSISFKSGSAVSLPIINLSQTKGITFVLGKPIIPLERKIISEVITPNNDGKNDQWKINEILFTEASKIRIFNLRQQLVFETQGKYTNDWEGTHNNGAQLPSGNYYYTLDLDGAPPLEYKGWIYIKRE